MFINILAIILFVSLLGVFIYVFAVPWLKGTMVKSDDPNCSAPGPCKKNSWCCKDPRVGGAYCLSKECSDIRLEQPSDEQIKFFNIYIICVIVLLIVLALLKQSIK